LGLLMLKGWSGRIRMNFFCSDSNKSSIRIVLISDTHSRHDALGHLPPGDLLIHSGDFTQTRPSKPQEYKDFVDWFSSQPHQNKVMIAGNRDGFMDTQTARKYEPNSGFWMDLTQQYLKNQSNFVYLEDEALELKIKGTTLKLFGTPWTAIYGKPGKAFQIKREDLAEKWQQIPRQTDILVTHMPPFGVRDMNAGKINAGSQSLLDSVLSVKPKLHVFGHIHESYGSQNKEGVMFVNAASVKPRSKLMNPPILVDFD